MTMTTILLKKEEMQATYRLADIQNIRYGKAKDFYNIDDIRGNDMKPSDSMIYISFIDGSVASFGKGWEITFY